ncbi:DUF3383 family protein [Ligilactobacillus equi]|uniref:DUF3383 family protein n=1 Tax=Ligilactobacillus equi DSM 15833 = JCM 10991 TaxID=1423740 RepID=A0A0R1TKA1_9LACO|nr:DUF3383 family protein [Ligilactobacillus equi]KRL81807.1 hypothetical protein FC36_GL001402 [Ligilactobacillus equi DSM 15833 = JCM 10991]
MAETLSDVQVVLNIENPSVPVNMGNLAVFVKGNKDGAKSYYSLDDVVSDYNDNVALQKAAEGFFAQGEHGEKFIVVTYADKLTLAADMFYTEGWEFAMLVPGTDNSSYMTDLSALAAYTEGKAERFIVYGLPATSDSVDNVETTVNTLGGGKRAIVFASGKDATEATYGAAALVGAVGNKTVGSVTWKFRTVGGVKPVNLNVTQIKKLHEAHVFTYVTKANINQTSEGFTLAGEFIDALHGDDWIKASIETQLQQLLSNSNKVTYDAVGIAQIDATVTTVLANATTNGIIEPNAETGAGTFTVTTVSRADSPAGDISARRYNGLSFEYTRSSAIHSVKVHGQINL